MRALRKLGPGQKGQGMAEYIVVVALIAIAAIGVVTIFSQNLRALFATSANELAGNEASDARSAGATRQTLAGKKRMSNFGTSGGT